MIRKAKAVWPRRQRQSVILILGAGRHPYSLKTRFENGKGTNM
jgi:hypothetical protein